jgi:chemotaxis protein methyltransferase CheR
MERGCMNMTDKTFSDLRAWIYDRCGILFPENKKAVLEGRLTDRLHETQCESYEQYYDLLRFDTFRDRELTALFDVVTTNETYFFRDQPQLAAFMNRIVPEIVRRNRGMRRVRIWSAACSTGDEPYTLAMLLAEQPGLADWKLDILGTDLNGTVLSFAQRGVYGDYAVRHVPAALRRKYFTGGAGQHVLSPRIKSLVRFMQLNLYDTARLKIIRDMDVIFCRNCLIYFDDRARRKILGGLEGCLRPEGYLVIGFSESLHDQPAGWKAVHADRSVVYQKTCRAQDEAATSLSMAR